MSQVIEGGLGAGREAIARHAWREAFEILTSLDAAGSLSPEDLESLGEASWWLARLDVGISARERAYSGYLQAGNPRRAAIVAIAVARDYFGKGHSLIGMAWINRAERLVGDEPDCVEHGYLERTRAVIAIEGTKQFDHGLEHARRAEDAAQKFADRDLLALAIQDQGRALVAMGQVDEGWALVDEATVAAVSGELSAFVTGAIYCNTITVCKELADWRRAGEWSEAAKRWCERQSIAGFPGMCRVYRAGVMMMRGAWPEAEKEARAACDELGDFNVQYAAEASYELGEIKLHLGDFSSAEEAFTQAHELGRDPQPGLARLRLHQGNVAAAVSCIRRALSEESTELKRATLLPAHVEIALAAGNLDEAGAALEELDAIAASFRTTALRAAAGSARGVLELAGGNAAGAQQSLRRAWRLWQEVDAPYEVASARLHLAEAYLATGDRDSAGLEARAAAATFERLGAQHDARKSRELLGEHGAPTTRSDGRARKTFMFTDIVSSTDLVGVIGDDAWHDLVRWHDETLRALFATHGGEEVDHAGDGFFVAFPDASAAVECGVAMQRKLRDHRRTHGFSPQVRIGLHSTEATRSGAGYKGKGVHEAARITALAGGAEIVASSASIDGAPLRFGVSEPREVTLKGISHPVQLVTIDWS